MIKIWNSVEGVSGDKFYSHACYNPGHYDISAVFQEHSQDYNMRDFSINSEKQLDRAIVYY